MEMTQKEIDALIFLLEDPDDQVYSSISEKIISLGETVIPELEKTWESDFSSLQQERIELIIHQIQFKNVKKLLINWKSKPFRTISEAMYLINQFQYPTLSIKEVQKKVKLIARDIWLELNNDLTPLEQISVFNQIFFKIYNFHCVDFNKLKKQHYFVSNLVNSKSGSNILLGLLYQTVATELKIPVYGICLPDLFLLARTRMLMDEVSETEYEKGHILFYIDPRQGKVFSKREITRYLQRMEIKREKHYYYISQNKDIIARYLNEIATQMDLAGDTNKLEEIWQLLELLEQ